MKEENEFLEEAGAFFAASRRKPNGIMKADKEARKSDGLIKRGFKSDKPLEKCVTDMTEVKCLDGKLYVSAVSGCFDSAVLGLAIDTNMKAAQCEKTLENTYKSHPGIRGCIIPYSIALFSFQGTTACQPVKE